MSKCLDWIFELWLNNKEMGTSPHSDSTESGKNILKDITMKVMKKNTLYAIMSYIGVLFE